MTQASLNLHGFFQPKILLTCALVAVIIMMILPVPAFILDLGLACSFALAILMLTITLFIERPLDFSAFPTVLLASLMLRLALNISSTKLIISEGHTGTDAAGAVIQGFAQFIMGGSVLLGCVIFCVLLIINFIVITKGAGRMAEVGARFALDGMPGKQLAIDSDVSSGAIDHNEAKIRRERELAETNFFGSLDGVSKFVKGDAIAGLLITLLNIVVGLIVGTMLHDMPLTHALETYSILTVGDGLVGQIPAVIISVAAALLLARGGASEPIDATFFRQLGRYPIALATVAVLMALFALIPGLPFIPFIIGAMLLGLAAWLGQRANNTLPPPSPPAISEPVQRIGDLLDFDEIHLEFAPDLVPMLLDPTIGLDTRINNMRSHIATHYGLILPDIRLTDDATLPSGTYRIRLQGVEQARDKLLTDHILCLLIDNMPAPNGIDVKEPVYNAAARWILPHEQEEASLNGLTTVTPTEVLATHLLEIIKGNLARLLSLRGLRRLLDEFTNLSERQRSEANRRLLEELIPDKVAIDTLLSVLRLLLEERVSIRNLPLILEAIAETRQLNTPEAICEHVRQRLGFQLVAELRRDDGTTPLIQLSSEWEDIFAHYHIDLGRGLSDVALPPEHFSRLTQGISERLSKILETGTIPALITSALRRRFLRTLVTARGLSLPVLSYEELGLDARPAILAQIPCTAPLQPLTIDR